VRGLAWSHDGTLLATTADSRVWLWSAAKLELVGMIDAGRMALLDVAFSPDDRELAMSGRGGDVAVWDVATGERVAALSAGTVPIPAVAWRPDGALLAPAGDDGTLGIWDAHQGRLLATRIHDQEEILQATWNRAGTTVLTATARGWGGKLRVWDVHRDERSV